jgi:Cellulose binding domain
MFPALGKRRAAALAAMATAAATMVVAAIFSAAPAQAAGTGVGYLHTNGNKIVDSTGATVRLTGIQLIPPSGGTSSPPPSPPASSPPPSPSPPASSPSPSASPSSSPGAGGCTTTYKVDSSWPDGFNASVTVRNNGTAALNPWVSTLTLPSGVTLGNGWNATVKATGSTLTAQAPSWAASLAPGASVTWNFQAKGASSPAPNGFKLNGVTCS